MSAEGQEFEKQTPLMAISSMQKRHEEALISDGFTDRAFMNAAGDKYNDSSELLYIQNGKPVVLGSEYKETKTVYVAFQNQLVGIDGGKKIHSKIVIVGSRVEGIIVPNESKGYTLSDFELVETMYDEAKKLQETVAPGYNIEQGIVRE